jgi:hypothetical protein
MGTAPVHYLYDDKGYATELFTGDSEGNVLYCDLTRPVEEWKLKSIFRLRDAGDKPIALSIGYLVLQDKRGNQWLFGGTSDITAPGQTMLETPSGENVKQQRGIRNDEQYIFGLHVKNPKAKTTDLSYPAGDFSDPLTLGNLTPLKYMKTYPEITPVWDGEVSEDQVDVGPNGWRLGLRPRIDDPAQPTEAEYLTSEPFFEDGVLYAATFIPFAELPDRKWCQDMGYSKLYAINPETGKSMWKGGQAYTFMNIKIVGISAAGGNLFLGVRVLRPGALKSAFEAYEETKDHYAYAGDSLVQIGPRTLQIKDPPEGSDDPKEGSLPNIQPKVPHMQYWREMF